MVANLSRMIWTAVIALAIGAFSVAEANAGRYGAVVIRNPSKVSIPFQMRLGTSGPWTSYRVNSKTKLAIRFRLVNGRVPKPHIRFDYVANDGDRVTNRYYSLDYYEVPYSNPQRGKPYVFRYYNSGTRIDLKRAD